MPKRERVSVKGMGLGAYFPDADEQEASGERVDDGTRQAASGPPSTDRNTPEVPADIEIASQSASPLASDVAHEPPEALPRPRKGRILSEVAVVDPDLLGSVIEEIEAPGFIAAAFRFTPDEIEALDDLIYQIKKRHGVRVLKQDIARLALAYLRREYDERPEDSVLGHYLDYRKRQSQRKSAS